MGKHKDILISLEDDQLVSLNEYKEVPQEFPDDYTAIELGNPSLFSK